MTTRLRNITDEDHEWLVELHNDPVVLDNVKDPRPITLAGHLRWWNGIKSSAKEERMIFTVDTQPAGLTKFYFIDHYNHNCTLGADIHRSHRGQGYAREMWSLMLERCFLGHNLHRVALSTMDYNHVGRHLYARLGFIEEGRMKDYHLRDETYYDAICMYMTVDDWRKIGNNDEVFRRHNGER